MRRAGSLHWMVNDRIFAKDHDVADDVVGAVGSRGNVDTIEVDV